MSVLPSFNLYTAFEQVAEHHFGRVALRYPKDGRIVSYGQLHQMARVAAQGLAVHGLAAGQIVAILHDKSPEAYATVLACLRLGLVYTALDPDSPWERLRRILMTCSPALVVNAFGNLSCADQLNAESGCEVIALSDLMSEGADGDALSAASRPTTGCDPAYLMFTSGSTGIPKGAVMSHANVLWFIDWARERFVVTPDDVLTGLNPFYFDNSVFDTYTALFSGATLVPFTNEQARDARDLVRMIEETGCTILFCVPSLLVYLLTLRALKATRWPSIRCIAFGGEGFPKRRLRELFELYGSRVRLENVYGPTECTCICSAYTLSEDDFQDMRSLAPLGWLAPNFDYILILLDPADQDTGELFLRGPQVGLGYYRDPERTARAFTQNPTHDHYIDIGYRCGDLVHRDKHGRLHFLGRVDNQIKHMGYRIELEEIEAALSSLDGVLECAVVYQRSMPDLGQIIAFAALGSECRVDDLRQALAQRLPSYMLPRKVISLVALPKNANGKIDRPALLTRLQTLLVHNS